MFALLFPVGEKTGSIKRWGGGGTGSQGHFRTLKRAPKNFPRNVCDGGGGGVKEKFCRHTKPKFTFLTTFKKNMEICKQKGTFRYSDFIACTKWELFITKKGTFSPLKKFRTPVPAPLKL